MLVYITRVFGMQRELKFKASGLYIAEIKFPFILSQLVTSFKFENILGGYFLAANSTLPQNINYNKKSKIHTRIQLFLSNIITVYHFILHMWISVHVFFYLIYIWNKIIYRFLNYAESGFYLRLCMTLSLKRICIIYF